MYAILVSYGEMDYPIQRERQVRNISTSTQSPYLIFRRYIMVIYPLGSGVVTNFGIIVCWTFMNFTTA